ncbi:hypothetical protein KIM322_02070 [Lactobacillus xylocopicola]|uniref:Uncharacterized protein n=1 Tax=Lactobacillus xylocopicola TaxID=2976676 RepID=A0ABN6SLQ2_9LACO|nr:hypothetical protein KIM322_02070 [Lactobacillus xylocopicola]
MIFLLYVLLLSIIQPVLSSANEVNASNDIPIDEQAKKAFFESKEYKKLKNFKK